MNCRIDFRPYERRFVRPLQTAHGEWSVRQGYIVRVEHDAGVGYGEVAPIPDFGTETFAEAGAFLEICRSESQVPGAGQFSCCRFALSVAMAGVVANLPKRDFEVAGLLPSGHAAIEVLRKKMTVGYRSFKWKIGVLPFYEERDCLLRLLEHLPEGARLRLDGNGGLEVLDFERWLNVLTEYAELVEFLEQPLSPGNEMVMAELADAAGVSVALDESLNGPAGWQWLAPDAWRGPLVVKPLLMGDVSELMEYLLPLAERVVWSSSFESGFGLSHALGLMGALPQSSFAIGFDTMDAFSDALSIAEPGPLLSMGAVAGVDWEGLWDALI